MRLAIFSVIALAFWVTSVRAQSCITEGDATARLIQSGYGEKWRGDAPDGQLRIWADENGAWVLFVVRQGVACIIATGIGSDADAGS